MSDDFDGCATQHVVFDVGQGLAGCHYDGLTSVDAQRVNILHVTHLVGKKTLIDWH